MAAAAAGERPGARADRRRRRDLRAPRAARARLAYALLAEPVDPAVEAERLAFRRAYRDVFAAAVARGHRRAASCPPQDARADRRRPGRRASARRSSARCPPPPARATTRRSSPPRPFCTRSRHRTRSPSHDRAAELVQTQTHEVFNQPPPLDGLQRLRRGPRRWREARRPRGRRLGRGPAASTLGADGRPAEAHRAGAAWRTRTRRCCSTHDRYGHRIDEVEFHPAWHELMEHRRRPRPARAPLARAAPGRARRARRDVHDAEQVEAGHGCPISMTYSAVPGAARAARARRGVGAALRPRSTTTRASSRRREGAARSAAWR